MKPYSLPRLAICAVALAMLLSPAVLIAQTPDESGPPVYRLSPAEKAAVLDAGTENSAEAARSGLTGGGTGSQIHGEVGAMIGTGGTRGAYGVAAIPLGDNAGAVVSFETSRFGTNRR